MSKEERDRLLTEGFRQGFRAALDAMVAELERLDCEIDADGMVTVAAAAEAGPLPALFNFPFTAHD